MPILSGAGGLDTDYVVHINDGTEDVKPIVLRLLPGEETIFELRLVNHGDPSNISVDASPPLIKAMRLKRSNHFVEHEEVIPVLARMPDDVDRVDGELLVTGESSTSRVPISLVRDAEDFEEETDEEDEAESLQIKDDYAAYDETDKDEVPEEGEMQDTGIDSTGTEDHRGYRTPPNRRGVTGEGVAPERRERLDYEPRAYHEEGRYWRNPGEPNGLGSKDYSQPYVAEKETSYRSLGSNDSMGQELSDPGPDSIAEEDSEARGGLFGRDIVSEQIVPIIMFFMIIVVLALTFYTSTIPEFLGALTSSILIVTLIIYGAATLLKA